MIESPQKIALFLSSLRAGGGEKMMVELAKAFAAEGLSVDLVVMKKDGALISQIDPRVNLVDLEVGRILGAVPKLTDYLSKEKPAVIMSVDEYSHIVSLWAAKRSGGTARVILRVGNIYTELFKRYSRFRDKFILPFLIKRFYKKADAIIAVSNGVADDIIAVTGIDKSKVHVIYNPKDLSKISESMKVSSGHAWFEKKTLPIILAVGRLREQKNYPLLIRAFANVRTKVPSRLVIVGAGREEMRLRDLVRELNLSDVVSLPGYVENPYMFMSKADIFAFPSLWEGMPNALLEAMIAGLPIISSDCDSGPREVLAPETNHANRLTAGVEYATHGVLCAVNDQRALEEGLERLLVDTELRKQYATKSFERAQDFDMQRGIQRYMQALGVSK